ncbi:MAG: hypothetical protein ACP5T5_02775 [Thermoprotei archaeon]
MKSEEKGEGDVVIRVESFDDLWKLSFVVKPGYVLVGKTTRQLKLRDEGGDVRDKRRVSLSLAIEVERVEFQPFTDSMRFLGRIVGIERGMEWVAQKGEHQSISVGVGDEVEIRKDGPFDPLERKLMSANESTEANALILSIDMSSAALAALWTYGLEKITELRAKREEEDAHLDEFFSEVGSILLSELQKRKLNEVIVTGPSVVLDEFKRSVESRGPFKSVRFNHLVSSYGGEEGLELLRDNPEFGAYSSKLRVAKERELIKEVFDRLSQGKGVAVGVEAVAESAKQGMVEVLLLSTKLLKDPPEKLMDIVEDVERDGGTVEIISEEGGAELQGLGGIAAILRWRAFSR